MTAPAPHSPTHPYDALTPEIILEAVETYGPRCTGGLLALNSYENRVYRVDTEDDGPLVAKFYRPRSSSRPWKPTVHAVPGVCLRSTAMKTVSIVWIPKTTVRW